MKWVLLGIVACAGAWWWFYKSKRPYRHRNLTADRFGWLLKTLAETLKDGSVLMIEHQGSERFIQFIKSEGPSGSCLGFAFPDAPWSREYVEAICDELSRQGIAFSKSETGDDNVPCFIEIEMTGTDTEQIKQALRLASIACQAMGLGDNARFTAHFRGELDSKSVVERSLRAMREARHQRT